MTRSFPSRYSSRTPAVALIVQGEVERSARALQRGVGPILGASFLRRATAYTAPPARPTLRRGFGCRPALRPSSRSLWNREPLTPLPSAIATRRPSCSPRSRSSSAGGSSSAAHRSSTAAASAVIKAWRCTYSARFARGVSSIADLVVCLQHRAEAASLLHRAPHKHRTRSARGRSRRPPTLATKARRRVGWRWAAPRASAHKRSPAAPCEEDPESLGLYPATAPPRWGRSPRPAAHA